MDHEPERSDVVAGTYLRREAKEADELDGHEEGRGDAVRGHETKELLGVPTIHEHEVGPEQRRTLGVRHRSCVIKRTRDKVHAVVAVGQGLSPPSAMVCAAHRRARTKRMAPRK